MGNLRTAAHDIDSAREAAAAAGRARRRARAGIAAVDALLAIIEDGHLTRANRRSGLRAEWQALLEGADLTVPAEIRSARNTLELHARLLEWQDVLLNRRDPRRSTLLVTLDGLDIDRLPRPRQYGPRRASLPVRALSLWSSATLRDAPSHSGVAP